MKANTCKYLIPESNKPCKYYIKPGQCSRPDLFRCVEYVKRFEPVLSYSGVNHFMRCPRLYYLSDIKGIQLKEQYQSDALKIGRHVDRFITRGVKFQEDGSLWQAKTAAMIAAYGKLTGSDWIDNYTGQHEFHCQEDGYPQVHGFIDLSAQDHFIEIKCSTRPDFYINPYWIHDQLSTYFLSNSNYEFGIVWAIRVPQLKQIGNFRDESLEDYKDRCIRDMVKRPSYYFPGYDKDTKSFGVKFYRSEFDLEALRQRYKWLAKQIQECTKADYFYQNRTQCLYPFPCDMFRICETDGISDDIYFYRQKIDERRRVRFEGTREKQSE